MPQRDSDANAWWPIVLRTRRDRLRRERWKTRSFAIAAHADQRYGGQPYETHLAAVVQVLCDFGYDEPYRQAG